MEMLLVKAIESLGNQWATILLVAVFIAIFYPKIKKFMTEEKTKLKNELLVQGAEIKIKEAAFGNIFEDLRNQIADTKDMYKNVMITMDKIDNSVNILSHTIQSLENTIDNIKDKIALLDKMVGLHELIIKDLQKKIDKIEESKD